MLVEKVRQGMLMLLLLLVRVHIILIKLLTLMIEFQSAKSMIEKWVDHWPILRINALQPYFFN